MKEKNSRTMEYLNRGPFETSQFYMWRCVIAMAHADGKVAPEERQFVEEKINRFKTVYDITDEQVQTLLSDLETPQDVADMLRHINNPQFRGQTIYFARLLAFADGEIDPSEQSLLDHMHLAVTEGLDMEAIRADAHKAAAAAVTEMDLKGDAQRPEGGLSGLIDRFALMLGIDLMDD